LEGREVESEVSSSPWWRCELSCDREEEEEEEEDVIEEFK
jgi:hypothetical protein